jgi:hypothetical protein
VSKVRRRGRGVEVRLSADEAFALGVLAAQVVALLDPEGEGAADAGTDPLESLVGMAGSGEPVDRPDDPALLRLLPDAYGDPAEAGEFRRLMESDLRRGKVEALRVLAHDVAVDDRGGAVVALTADGAETWLQALNDIRLTLGTRLGVTEDLSELAADLVPADPRLGQLQVYDWLGYLQESLVRAID